MTNRITPRDVQKKRGNPGKYMIIDVRNGEELEGQESDGGNNKIFGAINIPLARLLRDSRNGDLDKLKQVPLFLYSTVGNRADIATDDLNKLGFNALSIQGGFIAWKQEVEGRQNVINIGKFKEVYEKILNKIKIIERKTLHQD
jgi:rhodanese-related sulfurtransferase